MKELTRRKVKSFFPNRPEQSNKGTFGRVLVIAGSVTMSGAAMLCTKSVLKAGAGLVTLALPQSRQAAVAAALPEAITVPLPEADGLISMQALPVLDALLAAIRPCLVVLGPGMGSSAVAVPFMKQCRLPFIADADALNRLAVTGLECVFPREQACILTPHPGEMARLLKKPIAQDKSARQAQALELHERTGAVCVLKGNGTIVGAGNIWWKNPTGGSSLAKAGSGDVLSGIMAGLWAQIGTANGFTQETALQAAACAVYLHGLSGDLAAEDLTDTCVLAGELLDYLPEAIKQITK